MVLINSNNELKKGDIAPQFSLVDTKNVYHDFGGYDKKLTLVVFMCNHCPYVLPKIEELKRIQKDFKEVLDVVAINSNNHPDYIEDDFEHMQIFFEDKKLNFDYLFDETQEIAKSYGAVCTPDPFLFDKDKKLIWRGRINEGEMSKGNNPELDIAIKEFLEKGKITKPENPSMGCSIKWH